MHNYQHSTWHIHTYDTVTLHHLQTQQWTITNIKEVSNLASIYAQQLHSRLIFMRCPIQLLAGTPAIPTAFLVAFLIHCRQMMRSSITSQPFHFSHSKFITYESLFHPVLCSLDKIASKNNLQKRRSCVDTYKIPIQNSDYLQKKLKSVSSPTVHIQASKQCSESHWSSIHLLSGFTFISQGLYCYFSVNLLWPILLTSFSNAFICVTPMLCPLQHQMAPFHWAQHLFITWCKIYTLKRWFWTSVGHSDWDFLGFPQSCNENAAKLPICKS
jgi:hypothetical protein